MKNAQTGRTKAARAYSAQDLKELAEVAKSRSCAAAVYDKFKKLQLLRMAADSWISLTPAGEIVLASNGYFFDLEKGWTIKEKRTFEVTGYGFDGSTDETDDLVFWVKACRSSPTCPVSSLSSTSTWCAT